MYRTYASVLTQCVRAYNELDEIPAVVHPLLYQSLDDWGFDGFTLADDTGTIHVL